jgi:hypothetical protein
MRIFLSLLLLMFCTSCSVGMAMSGNNDPNVQYVKTGATRGEIELSVGKPLKTETAPNGNTVQTYKYITGNEPSAGRAWMHGIFDVLSLGLWEFVGTTYEYARVDHGRIDVEYGNDDRVVSITPVAKPVEKLTHVYE